MKHLFTFALVAFTAFSCSNRDENPSTEQKSILPSKILLQDGEDISETYYYNGNKVDYTIDEDGNKTTYTYNQKGQIESEEYLNKKTGENTKVSYKYDANGNLAERNSTETTKHSRAEIKSTYTFNGSTIIINTISNHSFTGSQNIEKHTTKTTVTLDNQRRPSMFDIHSKIERPNEKTIIKEKVSLTYNSHNYAYKNIQGYKAIYHIIDATQDTFGGFYLGHVASAIVDREETKGNNPTERSKKEYTYEVTTDANDYPTRVIKHKKENGQTEEDGVFTIEYKK